MASIYIIMNDTETKRQNYAFTWNNYSEDALIMLSEIVCEYVVYGKEIAPTTGTPHLQGFIKFKNDRSVKAVRKLFLGASIKPCFSSDVNNVNYCTKENDFVERGTRPTGQGKRSDLDIIRDLIQEDPKMRKVVNVATSYQSVKMAEQILKYHEKPRNWKCEVYWFWGSTGTGKSETAYEMCDPNDTYTAMSTAKWFDGYDSHSDVIIDDMRKDFCKFHELLRLLDRYAFKVETKGGTRQFRAKRIFITSCYPPDILFETREDIQQLLRRITEVRQFGEDPPELDE